MEKLYRPAGAGDVQPVLSQGPGAGGADWRQALPCIGGREVVLREPVLADAGPLWSMVSREEVSRFMATPPSTVEGFERFISWTHGERVAGNLACFAVVPHAMTSPVGIFQIRRLDERFEAAEWGFAIGSGFWGRGVYADAAGMVLEFAFNVIGVRRLQARAAVANRRATGALRKMGATSIGVLHGSLLKEGRALDQELYVIMDEDWRRTWPAASPRVH
jgi:ribosomal-protein-alanine N-acetyltransferase